MQPWRPIIFYNNSMDAAGTAKLAALYVLANINVKLTISPRWVDPWWGSSLASTTGPDTRRRAESGWVAPSGVHSPRDIVNRTSVLVINLIVNLQICHDNKSSTWMPSTFKQISPFQQMEKQIQSAWRWIQCPYHWLCPTKCHVNMLISNTIRSSNSITAMLRDVAWVPPLFLCLHQARPKARPREPYTPLWLVGSFKSSSRNRTFNISWQSAIHIKLAGCTNIKLSYQGEGHKTLGQRDASLRPMV